MRCTSRSRASSSAAASSRITARRPDVSGEARVENLEELVNAAREVMRAEDSRPAAARRIPRVRRARVRCRAGRGLSGQRPAHDAALGERARVRAVVPVRHGGRLVPAPTLAERRRTASRKSGASATSASRARSASFTSRMPSSVGCTASSVSRSHRDSCAKSPPSSSRRCGPR